MQSSSLMTLAEWMVAGQTGVLGRSSETLPRLSQLVEQPHVLNGDGGLISEGLKEHDLVVGEPARFATGHGDRPDRLVLAEQGHRRQALVATGTSSRARRLGQSGIGLGVGDIEACSIA